MFIFVTHCVNLGLGLFHINVFKNLHRPKTYLKHTVLQKQIFDLLELSLMQENQVKRIEQNS